MVVYNSYLQACIPPLRPTLSQSSGKGNKIDDIRIADFRTCHIARSILWVKFCLVALPSPGPWICPLDFTV